MSIKMRGLCAIIFDYFFLESVLLLRSKPNLLINYKEARSQKANSSAYTLFPGLRYYTAAVNRVDRVLFDFGH